MTREREILIGLQRDIGSSEEAGEQNNVNITVFPLACSGLLSSDNNVT